MTESMEAQFTGLSAEHLMQWAAEEFGDSLAVSTSFGIQSAVTLHMATQIMPNVPVIWVDTGYLHEETYQYATTLTRRLGLNLKVYESALSPSQMESRLGRLWESENLEDLNKYDQIRKVEPMNRALAELNVHGWVSGLRADQTDFRKHLPPIKRTGTRYRIYPILEWTTRDVYRYQQQHHLPQHPLFEQGYATVGDYHSSRPLSTTDDTERNTRFRGMKQECGLHT
ncbi:phosphoadenylyl-sulfate reductase [Rubripirellula obstinata]|nr:phosphoadenylyl-sulfate reductase [Rubripirellula obstinata]